MSGHATDRRRPSDTHRSTPRSEVAADSNRQSVQSTEAADSLQHPLQHATSSPSTIRSSHQFRIPQSPRSATGEPQTQQAKIAIPRLKRTFGVTDSNDSRAGGRHRVNHACEPCRHRKTKCSGERPICRHCQDFKIDCYYADGKRDRVKKQFGSMAEKVADYEKLLRSLEKRLPEDEASLIRATLDKAALTESLELASEATALPSVENGNETEVESVNDFAATEPLHAESIASGDRGSIGALDRAEEDFTREGARDTGYIGKNSDIAWMLSLRKVHHNGSEGSADHPELHENGAVHRHSYHLDDFPITTLEAVDVFELPTPETAHALFAAYMTRTHPFFPVVGQVNLTQQFRKFMANPTRRPPPKWLAILNMIFAISAKYSHAIQAEWKGDERDHLIYFTRARMLAIDHNSLFDHADLQHIQVQALMSFYLLCTGQVNRAWMVHGLALRGSTALGLNMRNESINLKDDLKEIRYRLWWAIYTLEHRLCAVSGRVSSIVSDQCTTPLPVPLNEDKFDQGEAQVFLSQHKQRKERAPSSNPVSSSRTSPEKHSSATSSDHTRSPSFAQATPDLHWAKDITPNSSLFFLHFVQLSRITQNIFGELYSPTLVQLSWSAVQDRIRDLSEQAEAWYRRLPAVFDFQRKQRDRDFYTYRLTLGFFYHSAQQMIHRPCLCRLDHRIPGQSPQSNEFNRAAAIACVEAAQNTMSLIPDEPNAAGLMTVGPWWSLIQWIVQAAIVLMLEISFRVHHMPQEAGNILESSKKAIRWLHALGEDDASAARAWRLCNQMLRDAASRIGSNVDDVPASPPGRHDFTFNVPTASDAVPPMMFRQQSPVDLSGLSAGMDNHALMAAYGSGGVYNPAAQYDQYNSLDVPMSDANVSAYAPLSDAELDFLMSGGFHAHEQLEHQSGMGRSGAN